MADEQQHTLALIADHLITAAQPLIEAATSLGAFMRLMGRIGFFASDIPAPYQQLATRVSDAANALENLPASPSIQDLLNLLDKGQRHLRRNPAIGCRAGAERCRSRGVRAGNRRTPL